MFICNGSDFMDIEEFGTKREMAKNFLEPPNGCRTATHSAGYLRELTLMRYPNVYMTGCPTTERTTV